MNNDYYLTNYRKFAEMLIYVLKQSSEPINETKALKLLYFAEAAQYQLHGKTISDNVTYYKNHYGPTPSAKVLMNIYKAMNEYLMRDEHQTVDYKSCKLSLQKADFRFKNLTAGEMGIIDQTMERYGKLSVQEIVKLAHLDPPYLASKKQSKINFDFVRFRKSDEDYEADLDERVRRKIANDISSDSRRKLKQYVEAIA